MIHTYIANTATSQPFSEQFNKISISWPLWVENWDGADG